MEIKCSPYSNLHKENDFSCYTDENLLEIKSLWNEKHPDDMIIGDEFDIIHEELRNKTKYMCKNEICWLKHIGNIDDEIFDESFAPIQPLAWDENDRYWLSNVDIMKIMSQYEMIYKNFIFIGPTPIDYDAYSERKNDWVWDELKNFDLNKYINSNISQIGIIFNLDKHTKPGSHWVALYVDLNDNRLLYFDSNGLSVPSKIYTLCEKIKEQGLNSTPQRKFTLSSNYGNEHQMRNGECGIYVIFFIINILTHSLPWYIFKNEKISDNTMNEFRDIYFNEHKNTM